MFDLCLFDLDGTLIHTDDLERVRLAGKISDNRSYSTELARAAGNMKDRLLVQQRQLQSIRSKFPDLNIGIFTRSPRAYANWMLENAYPNFRWDPVIAFEDVHPTKPHGDGVLIAMRKLSIRDPQKVVLVGDTDNDVRAAYNAGVYAVLDKRGWPRGKKGGEYWNALSRLPDAIISEFNELLSFLEAPEDFLPELERLLEEGEAPRYGRRFDEVRHFFPMEWNFQGETPIVHVAGRYFSDHESIEKRHNWHFLTRSIRAHKDATIFPAEWLQAVRAFLAQFKQYRPHRVRVSVIPHKPGRIPRLELFLEQLKDYIDAHPINNMKVTVHPRLLKYTEGAKSHHKEMLSKQARFENARHNLTLDKAEDLDEYDAIVLIDDVTTTGASLLVAKQILTSAGFKNVTCFSLAQTVGDLYPKK